MRLRRKERETAGKPGSVVPAGREPGGTGSHSSRPGVAPWLEPPTRKPRPSRPRHVAMPRLPIWCCSGWRLPRFTPVRPGPAPLRERDFGGLRRQVRQDSSLWPSSSRHRARALPCIPLCGARTFLYVAIAAAWPTPAADFIPAYDRPDRLERAQAGNSARLRRKFPLRCRASSRACRRSAAAARRPEKRRAAGAAAIGPLAGRGRLRQRRRSPCK